MSGWSGFTDEDLRKLRNSSHKEDGSPAFRGTARKAGIVRKPRPGQGQQREKTSRPIDSTGNTDISLELSMRLSATDRDLKGPVDSKRKDGNVEKQTMEEGEMKGGNKEETQQNDHVTEVKELDDSEAMHKELDNVQKFQQQQKVIEEANKHKRALLAKAIQDRQKKAVAEAKKLMKVQEELNHLDTLLTADVSIIRDKIEVASLEYLDAQKRYEKAEKEFITSKVDLFAKSETKEHLTEHLYTIIHQNEVRKAKKLVELMEKLAMEVTPEEMELTMPAIPQLTNFAAVATIHGPGHQQHNAKQEPPPAKEGSKSSGDGPTDITSSGKIEADGTFSESKAGDATPSEEADSSTEEKVAGESTLTTSRVGSDIVERIEAASTHVPPDSTASSDSLVSLQSPASTTQEIQAGAQSQTAEESENPSSSLEKPQSSSNSSEPSQTNSSQEDNESSEKPSLSSAAASSRGWSLPFS